MRYEPAILEVYSDGISSLWESDDVAHLVSTDIDPVVVHNGNSGDPPEDRKPPKLPGSALFGGHYMSCGGTATVQCSNLSRVALLDPDLLDDFDGENQEGGTSSKKRFLKGIWSFLSHTSLDPELDSRDTGSARSFDVRTSSGTTFTTTSSQYITGHNGVDLLGVNPNAGRYTLANFYDCTDSATTSAGATTESYASM